MRNKEKQQQIKCFRTSLHIFLAFFSLSLLLLLLGNVLLRIRFDSRERLLRPRTLSRCCRRLCWWWNVIRTGLQTATQQQHVRIFRSFVFDTFFSSLKFEPKVTHLILISNELGQIETNQLTIGNRFSHGELTIIQNVCKTSRPVERTNCLAINLFISIVRPLGTHTSDGHNRFAKRSKTNRRPDKLMNKAKGRWRRWAGQMKCSSVLLLRHILPTCLRPDGLSRRRRTSRATKSSFVAVMRWLHTAVSATFKGIPHCLNAQLYKADTKTNRFPLLLHRRRSPVPCCSVFISLVSHSAYSNADPYFLAKFVLQVNCTISFFS